MSRGWERRCAARAQEVDFFMTALSVASGMEYLHEHCQLLHRDLKSSNLLCDEAYTVKICDFGMARPTSKHGFAFSYTCGMHATCHTQHASMPHV